ncbi:MAG: class I SAM-dependent methyltransferase [Bdellovibrionales bacterium]|nr:class I SAM-dependent methyltransferase [Bdellovibrionales bacterium]
MTGDRYYVDHEIAYALLRKKGEVGWQKKTLSEFRSPDTESILRPLIARYVPQISRRTALDLGCGSGPTAHFLAELGFTTSGIDISPSAIALAKEMAAKFGREISYEIGDVVALEDRIESYDLIYDSHCVHCIVLENDRARLLRAISKALRPGGVFILDTMAYRKTADICACPEPLRFDSDFILWHKTNRTSLEGVAEYAGEFWCPQRRIYPVEVILDELIAAGLRAIETSIDDQGSNKPYMLRAVCMAHR